MEPEEYARMHTLERNHWWFRAKRRYVASLLERVGSPPPVPGVLVVDVGCGTGAVLEGFAGSGLALGLDDHDEALAHARERTTARLVRATATALPLDDESVDRLFLLDVAEHVPDDEAVFGEVRRVLRPSGLAVVHVPAHPWLWSPHDEAMHHVRRYTRSAVETRLWEAGLETVVLTPTFAGILAPVAVFRLMRRRGRAGGCTDFDSPGWLRTPLERWHRLEAGWTRRFDLPFGVSLAAVVRRAGGIE